MNAREALFLSLGVSASLAVALVLVALTLGSSNRDLQDRMSALQQSVDEYKANQQRVQRETAAKHQAELAKARLAAAAAASRAEAAIAALKAQTASLAKPEEPKRVEVAKMLQESAPAPKPAARNVPEDLYAQAMLLEMEGKGAEAVRTYTRAARSGSGKAANRLGEIYARGIEGISMNYPESLKWCNTARALGETPNCSAR